MAFNIWLAFTPFVVLLSLRVHEYGILRHVMLLLTRLLHRSEDPQSRLPPSEKKTTCNQDVAPPKPDHRLKEYKLLYHHLHNLEKNPEIIPKARDTLLSLFAETIYGIKSRSCDSAPTGIMAMGHFNANDLAAFLRQQEDDISLRLSDYHERRQKGSPMELFQTVEEAKAWLVTRAPSKLVDGAWLGHVHRSSTPFELRHFTKNAWQVFSEEVGDGDLSKNHAAIYRDLLQSLGAGQLNPGNLDFTQAPGMDNAEIWRSALAQLLISLFSHEFMAEMLGFNLHFECLTWETARAAVELRQLRIDSYYFLLHISIDNSDSGHAKMALEAVVQYLDHVKTTQGEAALQKAWRGVQLGYLLSESTAGEPTAGKAAPFVNNGFSSEVVRIFQAKASVAAKLHCTSSVRIGRLKLSQWLEQSMLGTEFLESLAQARPWVVMGDSKRSRLVKELKWNGKMFGAFTMTELDVLCNWINALQMPGATADWSTYWDYLGGDTAAPVVGKWGVATSPLILDDCGRATPWKGRTRTSAAQANTLSLAAIGPASTARLLPLWFAHASLLEGLVCIPIATCDALGSAVVRALRAQRGFAVEGEGVAGTDETRRTPHGTGLVELGLEMACNAGLPPPCTLAAALSAAPPASPVSSFAWDMLHWGMRPAQHRGALLGMAWAFVSLHEALAAHKGAGLLSQESRVLLEQMAVRERQALRVCQGELSRTSEQASDFDAAAAYTYEMISECLG